MKVKWWMFRIREKIVKYRTKNSDNREVVSLLFMWLFTLQDDRAKFEIHPENNRFARIFGQFVYRKRILYNGLREEKKSIGMKMTDRITLVVGHSRGFLRGIVLEPLHDFQSIGRHYALVIARIRTDPPTWSNFCNWRENYFQSLKAEMKQVRSRKVLRDHLEFYFQVVQFRHLWLKF